MTSRASAKSLRPVAWWCFDDADSIGLDSVNNIADKVQGRFWVVKGVKGRAVRFDGFTAHLSREAQQTPEITGPFTVEAWVALGAYPWNWCPLVDHSQQPSSGYFFGIDWRGRFGLYLSALREWQGVTSKVQLPLNEWVHLVGVYHPKDGITIYLNGKPVGSSSVEGTFLPARNLELLVGKHRSKLRPGGGIMTTLPTDIYLDGIIDELKMYNDALTAKHVEQAYSSIQRPEAPELPERVLPSGPAGPGRFGAYYTRLKYYDAWDALWRIGPHADVVVRFDEAGYRFVFWRGTNYIPCWVTENEIWYTNEFNETWGHGTVSCAEPMSDKQCRTSHVRIIESNDARVVVHWRYALIDILYNQARVDPVTGWGDWSDEVYTIYPDGTSVRKITLHSTQPMRAHEFQESIVVLGPGMRPEDAYEPGAVTLSNMKGETHTFSYGEAPPRRLDKPEDANIEVINIKSKRRPFLIVSPGPVLLRDYTQADQARFYSHWPGVNRDRSIFPWYNAWPVALIPSDGREAFAADRASHSSVSGVDWKDYEVTDTTRVRIMLHGLTDMAATDLVPLARSWLQAALLELNGESFQSEGYDQTERAYVLTCQEPGKPATLAFTLQATKDSPVINPAFIIKDWGDANVVLKVDGQEVPRGSGFRLGHRPTLESVDLIIWIKKESVEPVRISLSSQ